MELAIAVWRLALSRSGLPCDRVQADAEPAEATTANTTQGHAPAFQQFALGNQGPLFCRFQLISRNPALSKRSVRQGPRTAQSFRRIAARRVYNVFPQQWILNPASQPGAIGLRKSPMVNW